VYGSKSSSFPTLDHLRQLSGQIDMTAILTQCPYDAEVRSAMAAYLPMWPYQWGLAQLWQESLYDPAAKSSAGAMGIPQFMPDTWLEVADDLGYTADASPYDPALAIPAYAYYMAQLRKVWHDPRRGEGDRRRLTQASYNAGTGNLIKAQKLAGGSIDYIAIIAALPQVTGQANAKQTSDYVNKIAQWYSQLTL
jgi:soluble lytic murein transglycosylase-like protein